MMTMCRSKGALLCAGGRMRYNMLVLRVDGEINMQHVCPQYTIRQYDNTEVEVARACRCAR
jgi:hypothetical protein